MQVQPIQYTSTNQKPSFKAYFAENERINSLWRNASKSKELSRKIKTLSSLYKDHKLEITKSNNVSNGIIYEIYNYCTDKTHIYSCPYVCAITPQTRLADMIYELFCDPEFWGEYKYSLNSRLRTLYHLNDNSNTEEEIPLMKLYKLLTEES